MSASPQHPPLVAEKPLGFFARLSRARPTKPGEIYGVPGQGNTLWLSACSIGFFFFVWWLFTFMGWVKPLFVPSPMTIVTKFVDVWQNGFTGTSFLAHVWISTLRVFGAFLLACLIGLYLNASAPGYLPVALLAGVGFFGASFPMVMAHGRAFLPPHLVGRGVTLINLFGIGAAGIMQFVTGCLHAALAPSEAVINSAPPAPSATPYVALFGFYAALIAVGMVAYLFSQDRTD